MRKAFIDASSVIRRTEDISKVGEPRLKNLKLAIKEVKDKGYEPSPIGDASLWYLFGNLGDLPLEIVDELNSASIPVNYLSPVFREATQSLRKTREKTSDVGKAISQSRGVNVEVNATGSEHVIVWANPKDMGRIIGINGWNIKKLEDEFNLRIHVEEAKEKKPRESFKSGNSAFDEIRERLKESGLGLSEDAEAYAWRTREGSERWIILDGDREFEVSRWKDRKQGGDMRLSIHDRVNEEYLELWRMVDRGELRIESSGKQADEYLLGFAEKFSDSIIISHDKFRDYEDEHPFVRDPGRRLDFDVLDDEILIVGLEDAEVSTSDEVGESSVTVKGLEDLKSQIPAEEKKTGKESGYWEKLTESQVEASLKEAREVMDLVNRVQQEKVKTSPESTRRVMRDVGITLACLGLLGLVILPLAGYLDAVSLGITVGAGVAGGILHAAAGGI